MKKIWEWIKRDGLLHIESCAIIAIIVGLLFPWWATGIVALLVGIGKEIWDIKHGVANWHDIICDFIGCIVGIIVVLGYSLLIT